MKEFFQTCCSHGQLLRRAMLDGLTLSGPQNVHKSSFSLTLDCDPAIVREMSITPSLSNPVFCFDSAFTCLWNFRRKSRGSFHNCCHAGKHIANHRADGSSLTSPPRQERCGDDCAEASSRTWFLRVLRTIMFEMEGAESKCGICSLNETNETKNDHRICRETCLRCNKKKSLSSWATKERTSRSTTRYKR